MRARSLGSLLLASLLALSPLVIASDAGAQDAPDLAHLFPRRAPIEASAEGLVRLPLPAEVLVRARPDLSDVRVFDAEDQEVPYLVDRGDRPMPQVDPSPITRALPIEASRERARIAGVDHYRERFVVGTPGTPPLDARWVLRVDSARPRFVHAVRVFAVGEGGEEREIATGSFYRMGAPLRERLQIALPDALGARIRVEIEGQDGYLEPTFTFVTERADARPGTVAIPIAITSQRREAGRTILVIDRPPGVAPERIAIATSTASFVRRVEVRAIDPVTGTRRLGAGTVLRVEGVPGAEALEIDVSPATGTRLEIAIEDGDSPPLEDLAVAAIVRQPSLIFEGRSAARLRFGGGRVQAPRYDLQALFGTALGEELLERRLAGEAELGPIEDDPDFDPRPALSFAMRAGAPVELERFASVASLEVPDAREGLSRVTLGADALAAAAEDLRDVRIASDDARQWPYVLSEEEVTIEIPLVVEPAPGDEASDQPSDQDAEWSRYRLRLPVARAAPRAIELDVASELVDREVRIVGRDPNDSEIELGSAWLSRRPGDASPLRIELSGARSESLVLAVRDGDEAPLEIRGAIAHVASRDLYVTAPAGTYRLLAGAPEADAPDYEISRARALVLSVESATAELGPIVANPRYRAPSMFERAGGETVVMWGVLIAAVLVLGLLTLRVARSAPAPTTGGEGPPAGSDPDAEAEPDRQSEPPAKTGTD
ncbi:MAG: DUF3999 domain-containing protein [Myxococcota bacterium]|nr:DUF3999 domain-containing protein [Myxococcota bacterium]